MASAVLEVELHEQAGGFRVADRCLQIHGGMGLATEMPISQMWRDARSFMITEGPVEVMRMVLAREIFRGQV